MNVFILPGVLEVLEGRKLLQIGETGFQSLLRLLDAMVSRDALVTTVRASTAQNILIRVTGDYKLPTCE